MASEGQPNQDIDIPSRTTPTIICFHGSGDDPLPGWDEFVQTARRQYTVVLLDRGTSKISLKDANLALLQHLKQRRLAPPYVLIAHSYGGAFAKMFLHQQPEMVAGMLLVETGQEGGISVKVEQSLLTRTPLGDKPLSVIRGNPLIASWKMLDSAEAAVEANSRQANLRERRKFLEACNLEDERLKKQQLQMSRNNRYVHLSGCGHGVIHDRPDIVLEELHWVIEHLQPGATSTSLWSRFKEWWQAARTR